MAEREPALLRDDAPTPDPPEAASAADPPAHVDRGSTIPGIAPPGPAPAKAAVRAGDQVYVSGFWRRLLAGMIDLAIILPAALLLTVIAGKITGVRAPAGFDVWLLLLDNEPALAMAITLTIAVAAVYALVFQVLRSRTVGMRVLKMKIIDVYGDPPSPGRCVVRTLGYLAGVATLFLGFLWIGFDGEKRGLHDWIAGTYVIQG
jgi:uncharacterized RDD family membrane protein YckC